MRNAARILTVAVAAAAFVACGRQAAEQPQNQDMSVDENLAYGQLPANAEIETLPPDESSVTSSGELNAGDDNPDVNQPGNSGDEQP